MALCSESTGIIEAPCAPPLGAEYSCMRSLMRSPATTRVSLLAKQIFFLALIAAIVGASPANPTIAVKTISIGSASTTSHKACGPA